MSGQHPKAEKLGRTQVSVAQLASTPPWSKQRKFDDLQDGDGTKAVVRAPPLCQVPVAYRFAMAMWSR